MGAFKGRSRPPPRVQRKNQPCLGSLAPSGLCRNTFVPLLGTGVDCTFPLPVPSGPPTLGLQGLLIYRFGQKRETATFSTVTATDLDELRSDAHVRCPSEHLNVPQPFMTLLKFACSALGIGVDVGILKKQPLIPRLLARSLTGVVSLFKRRSETEIHARFIADLSRIDMSLIIGERACRMYGFRRGGAQFLLDLTGKIEFVMRPGGWTVTSSSIRSYLTAMNSRGTLRSTLRSFSHNEVTQVVAQLSSTYSRWTVGVARDVVQLALTDDGKWSTLQLLTLSRRM